MTRIILSLKVLSNRKLVATRQFSVEVAELREQLTYRYQMGGPRAHRYLRSLTIVQRRIFHPTAPPERWHNPISYSGRAGAGWTEYLPAYEVAVSARWLEELLTYCLPQNGFQELPQEPDAPTDSPPT